MASIYLDTAHIEGAVHHLPRKGLPTCENAMAHDHLELTFQVLFYRPGLVTKL
jgi:hypothetical protein